MFNFYTCSANIDFNIKNEATLLWIASQNGDLDIVQIFIRRSANVDSAKKEGVTSLWISKLALCVCKN